MGKEETKARNEKLNVRYEELWEEGFRGPVILDKLAVEFNLSKNTLYKCMSVKKLKSF